jgi:hypothetical protein
MGGRIAGRFLAAGDEVVSRPAGRAGPRHRGRGQGRLARIFVGVRNPCSSVGRPGRASTGGPGRRRRGAVEANEYRARFSLSLARKDADLIVEAAEATDLDLRLANASRDWLVDADDAALTDRDYSAVLAWILRPRD